MIRSDIMRILARGRRLGARLGRTSFFPALVTFLILGMLTTLWSLASPLMSVPDEPNHAIKAAAVARGQLQAQSSGVQGDPLVVHVPGYFADLGMKKCFAFDPSVTAACTPPIDAGNRALTAAGTTAGNYNPLYYVLVGLPSRLLAGAPALYSMRIISGLLSAAFMAMAFMAAIRMRRGKWPLVASAVALTPMVLFLSGSINGNSLEIVTTAAFFLNLCVALENAQTLTRVKPQIIAVGISGAVLANTRALSLAWLSAAFIVALLMFGWRPLSAIVKDGWGLAMTLLTGVGCAAGLAWLVFADSFKSLGGTPSSVSPELAFATMLDRTLDYANGYIGVMGWLDSPSPQGVQIFWHFAFAAVLLGGLTSRPFNNRWSILALIAAVIILPPILQSQVITELGYIWQGRYLLALVVLLLLACGVAMRFRSVSNSLTARSVARWTLSIAVAAHVYAFVYTLRRYTVGVVPERTNWFEMGEPLWQPPLTWQVLTALYLGTLCIGAFLVYRELLKPNKGSNAHPALRAQAEYSPAAADPAREPDPLSLVGSSQDRSRQGAAASA